MKAEELSCKDFMIGDWVMINPISYYQVEQIRREFDELRIYLKGTEVFATENDIMPVPITPEILEKNGFEYHDNEIGLYGVPLASYYKLEGCPFRVYCDGEPFSIWFEEEVTIKYVHQLQHILSIVGSNKTIII